ncbi:SYN1-like protein [Purpureocillium lilacinum]|uniref:SYN1-like protein n=1 Tax=Purpureocillium lilacinum TaxID=33203 RepID=A0A179GYX9_PURLI|nr:SYN1-like protein [Purpureocillium lilacinum]OAQ83205.1 SYN1-like protein [Purpureocillium lilacinum]
MSVSVLPSPSPLHTVEDRTPTTSGITAMVPPRGSKAATAKAHLMEVAAAMARTRPWTMATLVSGNVEMAPLAQNASSMGGGDPNGILNECRDIDRGVDEVDRNLEQLRMLQQRTLDDADSSASSANNRQLDALSSETMALYRSLTERVRLIKSNPDSRTPKNNPQVSRVDRRLKAAIQQYQQIESQFRKRTQDQMARSRRGRGHERRPGLQPGSDAERQARTGARRSDGGPGSPHRPGQDRAADGGAGAAVPGHGHAGRAAGGGRHADRAEGRGGRRQPGQGQPGDWRGRRHGPQDAQEEVDLPGHLRYVFLSSSIELAQDTDVDAVLIIIIVIIIVLVYIFVIRGTNNNNGGGDKNSSKRSLLEEMGAAMEPVVRTLPAIQPREAHMGAQSSSIDQEAAKEMSRIMRQRLHLPQIPQ